MTKCKKASRLELAKHKLERAAAESLTAALLAFRRGYTEHGTARDEALDLMIELLADELTPLRSYFTRASAKRCLDRLDRIPNFKAGAF